MSGLRPPGLGPIVGHVTDTAARLWIRAGDPGEVGSEAARFRRTVGVAAIRPEDGEYSEDAVYYFRLHREYDRTGIFTFGFEKGLGSDIVSAELSPDTDYVARFGTLTIDDPDPDSESIDDDVLARRLPPAGEWIEELQSLPEEESLARFRTAPDHTSREYAPLSFLLGSCRYPGFLWKKRHADRIFEPMLEEARGRDGRDPVRFNLMVGDQIYADTLNRHVPLGLADTFEEFQDRYLNAFGSRNMRRLLRQVPTYMILDDHEIEDNWSQDRINSARGRHVFNLAINAYMSYQWLHGPRVYGMRLFYDFECGGYPFFVLDERTQRFKDDVPDSIDDNYLLGRPSLSPENPSQLQILLDWLTTQQTERGDVPKFIVSPSVFVPNPIKAREGQREPATKVKRQDATDCWAAFPTTRRALLNHIVGGGEGDAIQNVVFLSGDIHCANVAKMTFAGFPDAEKLRAYSITSSAFYWPFPFADGEPSNYVHDSTDDEGGQGDTFPITNGITMDYTASNFTQEDNFTRVDIDPVGHCLRVVPYGKDGKQLESGGLLGPRFRSEALVAVLDLAEWA